MSGASTSKVWRILASSRTARSEWPPCSKKLAWAPKGPPPSSSAQISAIASSIGPRGGTKPALAGSPARLGIRKGLAIDLSVRRERESLQPYEGRGNHVVGHDPAEPSAQLGRIGRAFPMPGHEVRGKAHLAGGIRTRRDDGLAHAGVPSQRGLDLAQLNSEAPHLDLMVNPPETFERPVGPPAGKVPGTVEPSTGSGTERVGDEPLGRERRAAEIAAGQPDAADVQLADHPDRDRPQAPSRIDRRVFAIGLPIEIGILSRLDLPDRGPDGRLGRPVEIPDCRRPCRPVDPPGRGEVPRRRRAA